MTLAPAIEDLLSAETVNRRGLVVLPRWIAFAPTTQPGRADTSMQLYALLSLELWMRTFSDRTWTFESLAANSPVGLG